MTQFKFGILILVGAIVFWYFYLRKIDRVIRTDIKNKGGEILSMKMISWRDSIYTVTYQVEGIEHSQTVRYMGEGILKWFD
ncbi:hypothetical protein QE109_01920 [Fusibacter bizertensis]|uniref:DUF3139 domain-containing protein n=1 Tax=Fusibacter bizertensis TaxID=1488331 RepID=A0ABT6N8Y2_9FIRM|nr:hypothetical protein [Fusibacter bizertensis]MDH8676882.1 hypothetical protein [Fusibacter bizertensis]